MTFTELLDAYLDARRDTTLYPRDTNSRVRMHEAALRLNAAVPVVTDDWAALLGDPRDEVSGVDDTR